MQALQLECVYTRQDLIEALKPARRHIRRRYLNWKFVALIVGFVIVVLAWSILTGIFFPDTPSPPSPAQQSWVYLWIWPFIPWIVGLGFVGIVIFRIRRLQRDQPLVDRSRTILIDESGITWIDAVFRLECRWAGIYAFDETRNLFVLYVTDPRRGPTVHFHIVPKRAFAAPNAASEFRALLDSNIRQHGSAFPVLPPKAVAKPT